MYLCVRGTKPVEWVVMYLCVRGTKPVEWVVMYLRVRGTKPVEWVVMYLRVHGIDLAYFYDFSHELYDYSDSVVFFVFLFVFSFLINGR